MMGKDSGTYNDENGVLIEALGVSPDDCDEKVYMSRKTKECAVPLTRMLNLLMTAYSVDLCSGCHPTSSWRTKLEFPWGEEWKRHLQEMQNERRVFELTYEKMGTKMQEPLSCQFIRRMISTFTSYIVRAVCCVTP
jgi:hypothetical protein